MSVCVYHLGFRTEQKKKRSTAQVYFPIYHVQEPNVLYNDKVLLALPRSTEFVQTVSKGVCYIGSNLTLRRAIHTYAIFLQSTVNAGECIWSCSSGGQCTD